MPADLDYLAHLRADSDRFLAALRPADPAARVPSCPDWDADDLLWHLAEVQWFWAEIVRSGADGEEVEERKPPRPSDREALMSFYEESSRVLSDVLTADPGTAAWTWSSDHTVGFIRRRQAQEALIHRVDAELTTGDRSDLDADLASDGVDEVLRVMYGGIPDWGRFDPSDAGTLQVTATDTGATWPVVFGHFDGTSPGGRHYSETALEVVADATEPAATLVGRAADLDCFLWNREPLGSVERTGARDVHALLDEVLGVGID